MILEPRIAIVTAPQEVSYNNSQHFREALDASLKKMPHGVVVDLSHTDYLDLTALGVVIGFHGRLTDSDVGLSLVIRPQSNLIGLLKQKGLDNIFSIENSVEAAIGALCPA